MGPSIPMLRIVVSFCGVVMGVYLASCAVPTPSPRPASVAEKSVPVPEPPEPPRPHIDGPSLEGWKPTFPAYPPQPASDRFTHVAIVTDLSVPLYEKTDGRTVVGYSGVGRLLPTRPTGSGCQGGKWHEISGNAYLCDGAGVRIEERPFRNNMLDDDVKVRAPALGRPIPYQHGKARVSAPLLTRLPTEDEFLALDSAEKPGDLVDRTLNGTYLLTLIQRVPDDSERYFQLLTGEFIRESDVKPFPEPPMHGERLGDEVSLPLAFTHADAPVYCLDRGFDTPCGRAEKHARFSGARVIASGNDAYVIPEEGLAVRRDDVRVAERIPRPDGVDSGDKWIHIHLTEQTVVAYEGDRPVYATILSSGKRDKPTPTGLYTVYRVYVTKVMNGVDEDGPYQVQEVPWAMYFNGNYAVHGAYWHNVFGNTRSHGCVNLPPADARWLFYWSNPGLPRGWTANLFAEGPHVYITGETPPDVEKAPHVEKPPEAEEGSDA